MTSILLLLNRLIPVKVKITRDEELIGMTVLEWIKPTLFNVFSHFGKLGIVWNCSTHPTVDIKIKGQ